MKTKKYAKLLLQPYYKIIKEIYGEYCITLSITDKFTSYPMLERQEIEIPIKEQKIGAKAFNEKMKKKLKDFNIQNNYTPELLSFLHEIGHLHTVKNKRQIKSYYRKVIIIQFLQAHFFKNSIALTKLCYQIYFNLKMEKLADEWAMLYIKNHPEQVNRWSIMLSKSNKKNIPRFLNHFKTHLHIDIEKILANE